MDERRDSIVEEVKIDSLTGIYNRQAFYHEVETKIQGNQQNCYGILTMDIEKFKVVNDFFGVQEGNRLLIYMAQIMQGMFGGDAVYGRLVGDQFAVCLPVEQIHLKEISEKLNKKINEYPMDFYLKICVGLYRIDQTDLSVSLMCDRAQLACSSIKGLYGNMYAEYDETMRQQLLEEQLIVNDMAQALKNGEFIIYIQPKYAMADEKVVGGEALVRWQHPGKGMISPAQFIPVFEKNGFIFEMDYYIWELTCKQLRRWLDMGLHVLPISVNVSRVDMFRGNLKEMLVELVQRYQLDPSLLELEITETSYSVQPEQLIETVKELQEVGFKILMDDFGSGYSSLNMLKDVPVDILKLDLRFLEGSNYERGSNILNSILRLAHWLKLPVIAEGVETKTQEDFLRSLGCQYGQGYCFSRPVPVDSFENMLKGNIVPYKDAAVEEKSLIDLDEFWKPNSQINILFNSFVDGAVIYEYSEGNLEIIRANDAYFHLIDSVDNNGEAYSTHFQDYVWDEDRKKFLTYIGKVVEGEENLEFEGRFGTSQEHIIWLNLRMRKIVTNGERHLLYGSVQNVTRHREFVRKVLDHDERYQVALTKSRVSLWDYDIEKRCIVPVRKTKDLHGLRYPVENVPESLIEEGYVYPESIPAIRALYADLESGKKESSAVVKVRSIAGGYWWEKISYSMVYDEDGRPKKAVGVSVDVTEEVESSDFRKTEEEEKPEEKRDICKTHRASARRTILVVDDIEMNRVMLRQIFEQDYEVEEAEDGVQALKKLKKHFECYSMVILDIMMPEKDGFEVLQAMKEDEYLKKIPVVIVTEYNDMERELRALRMGADDLISKPYTPEVVERRVENIINKYEAFAVQNQKIQTDLRWEMERYRILSESAGAVIFDYNVLGDIMVYDRCLPGHAASWQTVTGFCGKYPIEKLAAPESQEYYRKIFHEMTSRASSGVLEYKGFCEEGVYHWLRVVYVSMADEQGNVYRIIGRAEDIEKQQEEKAELKNRAEKDQLSGLLNRAATEEQINALLSEQTAEECHAFLLFDIDNFKQVNDTRGHVLGDALLRKVGSILRDTFRTSDVVGRIGGDEFVAFLGHMGDRGEIETCIAVIQKRIREVSLMMGLEDVSSFSVGAALAPEHGQDFATLYREADIALYRAKNQGKRQLVFYQGQ